MSDILLSFKDLIIFFLTLILFSIPFSVPVWLPLIFFIVNLVRYKKAPEEDTENRKKYRKAFIIALIPTVFFAVIYLLLFIVFLGNPMDAM